MRRFTRGSPSFFTWQGVKVKQAPDLRVTASVGCAVLLEHSGCQDELHLVRMADTALYEAKRKGRDQPSAVVIG